jgi:predicted RNA-binding Zn-ribbon protein involved in translation (DUF1610 family)
VNVAEAAYILQELGASQIHIKADKVLCACMVHSDSTPSAAVLMNRHRGATYHCSACGHNEPLLGLIWRKILQDRKPYTKALAAYWEASTADAASDQSPGRLDYRPLSDRAVRRKIEVEEPRPSIATVRGTQLDIMGRLVSEVAQKPYAEEDFQLYPIQPPAYMLERGFDLETLDTWEIRDDTRRHRAVFPIRAWDGKIYGVTRRLYWSKNYCFRCKADIRKPDGSMVYACKGCGQKLAKYMHSPGLHRNEILYGEHLYKDGAIPVLVEGTVDAMRLWQHGIRPPLAHPFGLLGACPGEGQIDRLFRRTDRPIVILRDNDPPTKDFPDGPGAQTYAHTVRLARKVGDSRRIVEVRPVSKDAGDMDRNEVQLVVRVLEDLASGALNYDRVRLDAALTLGYNGVSAPHGAGSKENS